MNWEQAIRERLLAAPAVTAASNGVDWTERPQGEDYPWLVLQVISDPRPQDLKGFHVMRGSLLQFDALALERAQVVALRDAAIAAIAPAGEFFGVRFGRTMFEPVRDLGRNTETGFVHRDSFDATIWHD